MNFFGEFLLNVHRNCLQLQEFLDVWLECTLFLMRWLSNCEEHLCDTLLNDLFHALAPVFVFISNCLLHMNIGSRSLLHCHDPHGLAWVSWVHGISITCFVCKCTTMMTVTHKWVKQSLHLRCIKGYFTQCVFAEICTNLRLFLFTLLLCTLVTIYTVCYVTSYIHADS